MKESIISKIIRIILIVFIIIFFVADCFLISLFFKTVPVDKMDFNSFEEFQEAGAAGYMNMPEGATEQHYYLSYEGINIQSMYSYKIEDKKVYDRHMEHIKNYSCTDSAATHPAWDWYSIYEGTAQEKEQMDYLIANYKDMSYKDVLSSARIGKGFANGYGASVSEFLNLEYSLGEFPRHLPFEKLVDDEINTYTILYYRPKDTGSVSEGILVNEATRTFVIYYFGAAR